jgi:hypothetical protein
MYIWSGEILGPHQKQCREESKNKAALEDLVSAIFFSGDNKPKIFKYITYL